MPIPITAVVCFGGTVVRLDLVNDSSDHRRVLAVLRYLDAHSD